MKQHELGKDADTDILAIGFAATEASAINGDRTATNRWIRCCGSIAAGPAVRADRFVCRSRQHHRGAVGRSRLAPARGDSADARIARRAAWRRKRSRMCSSPRWRRNIRASPISSATSRPTCISTKSRTPPQPQLERGGSDGDRGAAFNGRRRKVYTHDDLRSTRAATDPYLELFKKAFYAPRAPHLNVLLKPGVYVNAAAGGTGHGTAYDVDRHVPVVFMGRDIKPDDIRERARRHRAYACADAAPCLPARTGFPPAPRDALSGRRESLNLGLHHRLAVARADSGRAMACLAVARAGFEASAGLPSRSSH